MPEQAPHQKPEHNPAISNAGQLALDALNTEFQEMVSAPEMQRLADEAAFVESHEKSIREVLATEVDKPKLHQAVEIARNLLVFLDQLELQAMVKPNFKSELSATSTTIKDTVDGVVLDAYGDRKDDIEKWLPGVKIFSHEKDDSSGDFFTVKRRYPPNYNYDSLDITAQHGREFVMHKSQNFHGQRTHDVQYVLDMDEEPSYDEYGFRLHKRFIEVNVEYRTDGDDKVLIGDPTSNSTLGIRWAGFGKPRLWHFTDTSGYTREQVASVIGWVEQHANSIFVDSVNVDQDNSTVTTGVGDLSGRSVDTPLDEIDLDSEIAKQKRYKEKNS